MLIWPDFPREVSAVVTGMDTLNRLSNKRLELAKCVKKAVNKKILNLPVLYRKAHFKVSIEVTAEELAEK